MSLSLVTKCRSQKGGSASLEITEGGRESTQTVDHLLLFVCFFFLKIGTPCDLFSIGKQKETMF